MVGNKMAVHIQFYVYKFFHATVKGREEMKNWKLSFTRHSRRVSDKL